MRLKTSDGSECTRATLPPRVIDFLAASMPPLILARRVLISAGGALDAHESCGTTFSAFLMHVARSVRRAIFSGFPDSLDKMNRAGTAGILSVRPSFKGIPEFAPSFVCTVPCASRTTREPGFAVSLCAFLARHAARLFRVRIRPFVRRLVLFRFHCSTKEREKLRPCHRMRIQHV